MAKKKQSAQTKTAATAQVFDLLFKQLLHLSNKAVASFINGLFGTKHPLDSKVDYLNTETVSKNLRRQMSDTMLKINGITYHIEVQIDFDAEMMIRVFEYGLNYGVWEKTFDGNIRTIEFPHARIIYLEGTEKTPQKQTLHLKFPDGSCYNYEVAIFNPLQHSVKELEKKGMAILLPFYVLKLRKQVEKAASGTERKKLSAKMLKLLDELYEAVGNCEQKGQIDEQDALDVLRGLVRLHKELFGKYDEFVEENTMATEKYVRYSTIIMEEYGLKIARNLLNDGDSPERVARNTGLPLRKVKALLKTAATEKQTA
jgi:hypothetical protein